MFCTSLKLGTALRFGLPGNDKLSTRKLFQSPHNPLESTAETCQFAMWAYAAHPRASLKLGTALRFGLQKNDKLGTRKLFKSPHDPLESTAKTCQFVMWAYAAHPRGYFSFTRKVSKSVSKGLPLRYPLRLKIFQNLLKNGTTVPFLGTMARNFIFPQSITLSCPHSHFVTFPLIYHESFVYHWGAERVQEQGVSLDWNRKNLPTKSDRNQSIRF